MEKKRIELLEPLLPNESAVRSLIAEAKGDKSYKALNSLEEAQNVPDGVVIFEGDYGGTIYLTCAAKEVKCSEEILIYLLKDIDKHIWRDEKGTKVFYERHQIGAIIAGGMGGGIVTNGIWIHEELVKKGLEKKVKAVLNGEIST